MNARRFFARNPVFTTSDYHQVGLATSPRALRDYLGRAVERGELLRIRNSLFAVVPPDVDADQFEPDRFQVMATLRRDAVFCGHSALELLGVAYSVWNECLAYSRGRREGFLYRSIRYRPIAPPSAQETQQLEALGLVSHDRAGVLVRSLGAERVLVEGFRNSHQYGGLGEFLASVQTLGAFDNDLLLRILMAYDEKRLYASVGWFLEAHEESSDLLETLEAHRPQGTLYLDRALGSTRKASRWNLLVPERLLRTEEFDAAEF